MDIELRAMNQVLALAREGSFAKAARVLHISQPALSRSIKEVERRVGFTLFERGRQGAELTDAGKTFFRLAAHVVTASEDMHREIALLTGLASGELRIGAGVYPSELFMGRAVGRLMKTSSMVQIRIINDSAAHIIQLLRRREIDIGFVDPRGHEVTTEFTITPLATFTGYAVVRHGHPLFREKRIGLDKAIRYPLCTTSLAQVLISQINTQRNRKDRENQELIGRWRPTVLVDSVNMMKETVETSDAVTFMPYLLIDKELQEKRLAVLPFALNWLQATFSVMHLAHRTITPLGAALIASATEEARLAQLAEQRLKIKWRAPR